MNHRALHTHSPETIKIDEIGTVFTHPSTPASIRRDSVLHLGGVDHDKNKRIPKERGKTLYDMRLGTSMYPNKPWLVCDTCKRSKQFCRGHHGHINLGDPQIEPEDDVRAVYEHLQMACNNCGNALIENGSWSQLPDDLVECNPFKFIIFADSHKQVEQQLGAGVAKSHLILPRHCLHELEEIVLLPDPRENMFDEEELKTVDHKPAKNSAIHISKLPPVAKLIPLREHGIGCTDEEITKFFNQKSRYMQNIERSRAIRESSGKTSSRSKKEEKTQAKQFYRELVLYELQNWRQIRSIEKMGIRLVSNIFALRFKLSLQSITLEDRIKGLASTLSVSHDKMSEYVMDPESTGKQAMFPLRIQDEMLNLMGQWTASTENLEVVENVIQIIRQEVAKKMEVYFNDTITVVEERNKGKSRKSTPKRKRRRGSPDTDHGDDDDDDESSEDTETSKRHRDTQKQQSPEQLKTKRLTKLQSLKFKVRYKYKLQNKTNIQEMKFHQLTQFILKILKMHGSKRNKQGIVYCALAFGGCGTVQHMKTLDGQRIWCRFKGETDKLSWRQFSVFDREKIAHLDGGTILAILSCIPDENIRLLSLDPTTNHPKFLVKTVISGINPSIVMSGDTYGNSTSGSSVTSTSNNHQGSGSATAAGGAGVLGTQDDIICYEMEQVIMKNKYMRKLRKEWEQEYGRCMMYGELFHYNSRTQRENDFLKNAIDIHNIVGSCLSMTPKILPYPMEIRGQTSTGMNSYLSILATVKEASLGERLDKKRGFVAQLLSGEVDHSARGVLSCSSALGFDQVSVGMKLMRNLFVEHTITAENIEFYKSYVDWVQARRNAMLKEKIETEKIYQKSKHCSATSLSSNLQFYEGYVRMLDLQHEDVWPTVGTVTVDTGIMFDLRKIQTKYSDYLKVGVILETSDCPMSDFSLFNRQPSLYKIAMQCMEHVALYPETANEELFAFISDSTKNHLLFLPPYLRVSVEPDKLIEAESAARYWYRQKPGFLFNLDYLNTAAPVISLSSSSSSSLSESSYSKLCSIMGPVDFRVLDDHPCIFKGSQSNTATGGDYDGDGNTVLVPITPESKIEQHILMVPSSHTISVKNNSNTSALIQDIRKAIYIMTKYAKHIRFTVADMCSICFPLSEFEECKSPTSTRPDWLRIYTRLRVLFQRNGRKINLDDWYRKDSKDHLFEVKDVLFCIFPRGFCYERNRGEVVVEDGVLIKGVLGKKDLGISDHNIITTVHRNHKPTRYRDFMNDMCELGKWWFHRFPSTLGLVDMLFNAKLLRMIYEEQERVGRDEEASYTRLQTMIESNDAAQHWESSAGSKLGEFQASCFTRHAEENQQKLASTVETELGRLCMQRDNAVASVVEKNLNRFFTPSDCPLVKLSGFSHPLNFNGANAVLMVESGSRGSVSDLIKLSLEVGTCTMDGGIFPLKMSTRWRASPFADAQINIQTRGFVKQGYLAGTTPRSASYHAAGGMKSMASSSSGIGPLGLLQQTMTVCTSSVIRDFNGCITDGTGKILVYSDSASSGIYDRTVRVDLDDYERSPANEKTYREWVNAVMGFVKVQNMTYFDAFQASPKQLQPLIDLKYQMMRLSFEEREADDKEELRDISEVRLRWLLYRMSMTATFSSNTSITFKIPFDVDDCIKRVICDRKVGSSPRHLPAMGSSAFQKYATGYQLMVKEICASLYRMTINHRGMLRELPQVRRFTENFVLVWYLRCQLFSKVVARKFGTLSLKELQQVGRLIQESFHFSRSEAGTPEGPQAASSIGENGTQKALKVKHLVPEVIKLNTGVERQIQVVNLATPENCKVIRFRVAKEFENKGQEFWSRRFEGIHHTKVFLDFGFCENEYADLQRISTIDKELSQCLAYSSVELLSEVAENKPRFWSASCMRFVLDLKFMATCDMTVHTLLTLMKKVANLPWFDMNVWEAPGLGFGIVYVHMRLDPETLEVEKKEEVVETVKMVDVDADVADAKEDEEEENEEREAKQSDVETHPAEESSQVIVVGKSTVAVIPKKLTFAEKLEKKSEQSQQFLQDFINKNQECIERLTKQHATISSEITTVKNSVVLFNFMAMLIARRCIPQTGIKKVFICKETNPVTGIESEYVNLQLEPKTTDIVMNTGRVPGDPGTKETSHLVSKRRFMGLLAQECFDPYGVYCTMIKVTHAMLGAGAAKCTSIKEQVEAMQSISPIHYKHPVCIANEQFKSGYALPLNRTSLGLMSQDFLEQSGYQQKSNVLNDAAVTGRKSYLSGVLAEQMVGKRPRIGANRLYLD